MHAVPTILVAGVVPRLYRLRRIASVRRAEWDAVVREALRPGIDLVILGASPAQVDARPLIGELRREPTSALGLLHVVAPGATCQRCSADVCLPAETRPDSFAGIVRILLRLRRAREEPRRTEPPHPLEQAARQGASLLPGLVDAMPGIVYLYDLVERRLAYVSPSVEPVLGYAPSRIEAMSSSELEHLIHPDDLACMAKPGGFSFPSAGERPFESEFRARTDDGRWRSLRSRAVALFRADGRPDQVLGLASDVTEERQTREMLERAQRLEALGRLVGGIAHDFNNILGVITGHGQLTQRLLPRDHPAAAGLEQVVKACERAAALTQQLLAFSRQPSRDPRALDVNAVVSDVAAMLERVIAEDVEVEVRPGAGLGAVKADAIQIEQILLNLAVNARDAMPAGGRLTIETRNADLGAEEASRLGLAAGPYVLMEVSDTGTGMDPETRKRIFEPFFTTKPEGVGSGLGLATVRGIVERCSGAIAVESEPGSGTRFQVFLPRVAAVAVLSYGLPGPTDVPEGRETILLVEDADPVRDVTRELLEGLGYTVLPASHGAQALALARSYPGPIHMLLTDVVMPRLGGSSLAAEVSFLRPQIRVLYMSGYSSDALPGHDGLAKGTQLLRKPFTRSRLAQAVRDTIGQGGN